MSSALIRRLKLTTIHDVSSAWAGLGSALSNVWKQTGIPASLWATAAVTTYLVCISVLHITSSTLLHFQTFNSSLPTNVSTTLGWVDLTNFIFNPIPITASLPAISQFPGIVSPGLSNSTVYDIPQTTSVVGLVTVNATTVTSSCGLIPNVTYYQNNNTAHASFGNGSVLFLTISPPWMDQIQVLQLAGLEMNDPPSALPSVLLMVSTLLEIEPSVQKEVAVPVTVWESPSASQSIDIYFVQCSLSTNNTTVVIDMQTDTLQNPIPVPQSSTQWEEMDQWTSTEWSVYIGQILGTSGGATFNSTDDTGYVNKPLILDEYIMSLVGPTPASQYRLLGKTDPPFQIILISPCAQINSKLLLHKQLQT